MPPPSASASPVAASFGTTCCADKALEATPADTRREALFAGLTLVGLALGWGATHAGWTPGAWLGYGAAYGFGGWYGARGGLEAMRARTVDIDLLMVLAALGALAIGQPFEGALLLFLFSLSNVLQHRALGRSRRAIEALLHLRPDTALVLRDGAEVAVPVEEVVPGERFVLRPGSRIPLDGTVVAGASSVDEASLTGESAPADKAPGDGVFAGTINGGGSLEVRVTRTAGESALARMVRLVEEAQREKAGAQRLIDRFEQPYALGVLALTAAAFAVAVAWGEAAAPAFYRAMTLMVAASPCALVISTPASVLSAIAAGARRGILFKGGLAVEETARVRVVCFDKTGTLTEGRTRLVEVAAHPAAGLDDGGLLALAAAVQQRSEHHLAAATRAEAEKRGLAVSAATAFQASAGKGVAATVAGRQVAIGNPRFFEEDGALPAGWHEARAAVAAMEAQGHTAVVVVEAAGESRRVLGWMGFADTLRPGAPDVVQKLRRSGIAHVVMLTGDNPAVGAAIGAQAGVDEVFAGLLPEEKVAHVRRLAAQYGPVAMIGDGVNDAPALAAATVGIAMGGAGTDVALETADVVLMADDLGQLPYALQLSRATRRTLAVNIGFALAMIAAMVVSILAAGLPLPLAVVGHEGSTVLVSLNGLRLLGYRGR